MRSEGESGGEGRKKTISGDNGERDPPVPIPNTEVKPLSADGTWLETARESRTSPDSNKKRRVERFSDSIFLSSSMAEHSAVNRVVVGSSPTWGANQRTVEITRFQRFFFLCFHYTMMNSCCKNAEKCSKRILGRVLKPL